MGLSLFLDIEAISILRQKKQSKSCIYSGQKKCNVPLLHIELMFFVIFQNNNYFNIKVLKVIKNKKWGWLFIYTVLFLYKDPCKLI